MEKLSRSEIKRQHKQIEQAAREVLGLNDQQLARLKLGEDLVESIALARSLKGGALKRQTKYISKLLKEEALGEILEQLKWMKGSKLQENKLHHQAEFYRDAVINETLDAKDQCIMAGVAFEMNWPSETIDGLVAELPGIDEKDVRRLAYQYARTRNKVHYRELFRTIRAAVERRKLDESDEARRDR